MDIVCHDLAPVPTLFLDSPDSDFAAVVAEVLALLRANLDRLERVERDLDAHAKVKKAQRLADRTALADRSATLPGVDYEGTVRGPHNITLGEGRPRTPALVVALFLLLRGSLGGFKTTDCNQMLVESRTLAVFFARHALSQPRASTLIELTNAVSVETREAMLDAQMRFVLREALDDFTTVIQDSTAVLGNTERPTDSGLTVKLLERMLRVGQNPPKVGLPALRSYEAERLLEKLTVLDREINMMKHGRNLAMKRKQRYMKVIGKGRAAHASVTNKLSEIRVALAVIKVLPSQRERAQRAVTSIENDLRDLSRVLDACKARIVDEVKVATADKVVSTSDPDAAFIVKGQRDPVLGYKPQLARSGGGFVTGLLVPRGNAADAATLISMFETVCARTSVVPERVIVDDGYASASNRRTLKGRGVRTVSIGGAKGRALTPTKEWFSAEHVEARDDRSAVESLMFTLKDGYDFGEVSRRGQGAVHAELLEKVPAYNLRRIVGMRAAKRRREAREERLAA
jgi:hypothetical protein